MRLVFSYGEIIRADIVTDRLTGRSKGVGTVRFSTAEQAELAMRSLHEREYEGRRILIKRDELQP